MLKLNFANEREAIGFLEFQTPLYCYSNHSQPSVWNSWKAYLFCSSFKLLLTLPTSSSQKHPVSTHIIPSCFFRTCFLPWLQVLTAGVAEACPYHQEGPMSAPCQRKFDLVTEIQADVLFYTLNSFESCD